MSSKFIHSFRLGLAIIASACVWVPPASANRNADEVTETLSVLNQEVALIDLISDDVEHLDFARLTVLKLDIERLVDTIQTKGLFHRESSLAFYALTKHFEYSKTLFQFISSDRRKAPIEKLQSLAKGIAEKYGYDDDFATRHTFNDFMQMKKLFLQLLELPVPEDLRGKIKSLDQFLLDVLGPAKEYGDRPITFEKGKDTYYRIQALYPDLEALAIGNAAYDIVVEIQGLNETYAEFAQIHRTAGARN